MSYIVAWGKDPTQPNGDGLARVSTPDELTAVLDTIGATGGMFTVDICPANEAAELPEGMQIGVGHPERSFVYWIDDEGGKAFEPDLPPAAEGLRFDYGGQPIFPTPDELRVRPTTARLAAEEYVRTGRRPTGVAWHEW